MPNIEYRKNGGKITWDTDDWLSGLHPNYSTAAGDSPVPTGNNQLTFASSMNPYRYFGYASPGFNPTDVTNVSVVTDSAIRQVVIGYDNNAGGYYGYGINSSTKVFRIDPTTGELANAGIWPHTITPASGTPEGLGICNYSGKISGTRAPRIYFSYNNTGATAGNPLWNVGYYDLNGNFDDDFMTTAGAGGPATPLDSTSTSTTAHGSSAYPHPMIVGDDDILYIGDGNYLHAYDGANSADNEGKFFPQVLVLPDSFRITSFARLKQRLVIFGYKELNSSAIANASSFYATEAKAYFWDYLSLDPYDSVNLNDNYCNGAFEYMGTVGCFTQGRKPVPASTQFSTLKLFNGNEFDTVTMFDNNIPIYGGVQVVGDTIMFNAQGAIYQYGSPYPGFPNGLNKVTAGTGTTSGALVTLSTTLQLASTGATTSGGLQKITNQFTTGSFAAALAKPEFPEGMQGKAKSVTITFAKTSSSGRDTSISLVGNNLSTTTIIANVSTINSSNIRKRYQATSTGSAGSLPKFDDLKPIIVWGSGSAASDAPVLQSIEVEYENVNLEAT